MDSKGQSNSLRVRDIRTLPFLWIQRALLEITRPSWRGIVAYNALAYYAGGDNARCRDISIPRMADRVGVSEDTMKRGLEELEKKKAIKIKARYAKEKNGKRQQLPNEYILLDLETPKHLPI